MSDVYDRTCTTCGHKINDHDANECWKTVDGKQCECGWMGVPDECGAGGCNARQRTVRNPKVPFLMTESGDMDETVWCQWMREAVPVQRVVPGSL